MDFIKSAVTGRKCSGMKKLPTSVCHTTSHKLLNVENNARKGSLIVLLYGYISDSVIKIQSFDKDETVRISGFRDYLIFQYTNNIEGNVISVGQTDRNDIEIKELPKTCLNLHPVNVNEIFGFGVTNGDEFNQNIAKLLQKHNNKTKP